MDMLKEIMLPLPEELYRQLEQLATETQRNVVDVLLEAVSKQFSPYPVNPNREAMKKEIVAYEELHTELALKYLGEYVAIYQGKLADHDLDPVALHQRITAKYPNKVVLSRRVQSDPKPVLQMRSPRLER
jgi:hypothetical protein